MDTNSVLVLLVYVFLIVSIVIHNRNFATLRRELLRQERKLDAILKHLDIDWQSEVDPEVLELIRQGRKIEAVKAYKQSTGVALKEALAYVESFWERND
ncbi:MAG: hypothetical protein KatS3mg110_3589 [Pirellulaceae bacterium]|nr:MAG: hypothetical protein KatS3mg110_3589 [Pirellulaceae bacterium]